LMFDGIVFDMDGVLFDTENVNFRAWQKASAEMGHPYISDHYPECIGRTRTDDIQLVRRLAGEDFPVDEFFARTSRYCRELMEQEGVPVKPGVEDILRYLQERHIPVALASCTFRDRVMMRLDSAGFTPYFRCITAGDEVSQGKPSPEIYQVACRKLGLSPDRCLAVEDSYNGIRSASGAGLTVAMVPDMLPPIPELEPMLWKCFDCLADLQKELETM